MYYIRTVENNEILVRKVKTVSERNYFLSRGNSKLIPYREYELLRKRL